jgi:hypothetical protein
MWRVILLGALGLIIGTRARTEGQVILMSLFFGLLYGGIEVLSTTMLVGSISLGRALFLMGLGLVMAAPVYATAEIWRRTRTRAWAWLRRLVN